MLPADCGRLSPSASRIISIAGDGYYRKILNIKRISIGLRTFQEYVVSKRIESDKYMKVNFNISVCVLSDGLVTIDLFDSCPFVTPVDISLTKWRNFEYNSVSSVRIGIRFDDVKVTRYANVISATQLGSFSFKNIC